MPILGKPISFSCPGNCNPYPWFIKKIKKGFLSLEEMKKLTCFGNKSCS
jgi:hypothetical protein